MNGYRARRIDEVFKGKEKVGVDDFRNLHRDFTCLPGLELVTRLQAVDSLDPDVGLALERLKTWNGVLSIDSVGGCIYEVTRYHLVRNLFEPSLGKELTLCLMGQGFNPVLLASHEFHGHDTVILLRMLDHPDSWWIQQAGGFEALVNRSLKEAIEWLRNELGDQPDCWQWGRLHRAIFPHPLGLQKPLDLVFNRGPVAIGGDTDTPCQTAVSPHDPYNNNAWSPSFRQIVNMGDLSKSLLTSPPGQSGQLGSQHYDDLIMPWIEGEYCDMLWEREQIENQAKTKLVMNP
jgi:penicillin amidase